MTGEGTDEEGALGRMHGGANASGRFNAFEVLGILASGVAHDFNNLLVGIDECIKLALDPSVAPDVARRSLEESQSSVQRGRKLVQQLFAFARGEPDTEMHCHLDETLRASAPSIARLLDERIELALDLDAAGASVPIGAGPLEQVLRNLCSNASDAMPDGGRLVVSTRIVEPPPGAPEGTGERARLIVRDSGEGMHDDTLARAIEPFFTTKAGGHGTGLGLSTVYGIARYVGGQVELESAIGRGTTVRVELPAVRRTERR